MEINRLGSYDLDSQGKVIPKSGFKDKIMSVNSGDISEYNLPSSTHNYASKGP